MGLQLDAGNLVTLVAGALIMLVGVFVLVAKPASTLHRLFFVLAMLDGASTSFFALALMAEGPVDQSIYFGTYYYHYLAFLTLLCVFGLIFPRPIVASSRATLALIAVPLTAGLALTAVYAYDHGIFWRLDPTTALFGARLSPAGNIVNVFFGALIALLVWRFTGVLAREDSPTHRRQASYVLAGMVVAYAPHPTTVVIQALAATPAVFLTGRFDRLLSYWSFALVALGLIASAVRILRDKRPELAGERRVMQGAYGAVALIALASLFFQSAFGGVVLRGIALVAYPVFLGFAIARYEVFDIDRKLGRATTFTLVAGALAIAFILGENALQNVLTEYIATDSAFIAGSIAAIGAAVLSAPLVKLAERLRQRVLPDMTVSELDVRKREIYMHTLETAMGDGEIAANENRTLAALRDSLGVSMAEHEALLAGIVARREGTPNADGATPA